MAAVAGFSPRGDGKPYKQIEKLLMPHGSDRRAWSRQHKRAGMITALLCVNDRTAIAAGLTRLQEIY